jgi:DNA-binding IclR family transcriptional regulator
MADVQSLKRAFEILRAVSGHADGVGLAVLSRQVGLPKSTVARMLTTLENLGAVERLQGADGYRIGAEIVTLAAQVAYPRSLIVLARPTLQQLAQNCGETVSLGVLDGDMGLTIDQIDSWRNFRLRNWVGERLPLHCTSDGKLYLAHWPETALTHYLQQPLKPYSPNTITDPARLRCELKQIRAQGYAWNNREHDYEIVSIAAPIYDDRAQVVAALCMFGPAFRFPSEAQRDEFVQITVAAAHEISQRLQGHLPGVVKTTPLNGVTL